MNDCDHILDRPLYSIEWLWPCSKPRDSCTRWPIVIHSILSFPWLIVTMLQAARFRYSFYLSLFAWIWIFGFCFEGSTCGRSVLVWEAGNLKRTKNGKRNLPCLFKQSECVKTLFRTVLFKFLTFMTALLLINLFTCTSTTVQLYWPLTASGGCGRLYCL